MLTTDLFDSSASVDVHTLRSEFALWISEHRVIVADRTLASLSGAPGSAVFPSPLLIRTLVGALATSIATGDPTVVTGWARAACAAYPREVVGELVDGACSTLARLGEQQSAAFAEILVFIEIVKAEVHKHGFPVANGALREDSEASTKTVCAHRTAMSTVLSMLKARDESACAHAHATAAWCRLIATAMNVPDATAQRIVIAGLLHSIGKVATPDSILQKNGDLDPDDALFGADMLLEIPSLAQYAPIVRAYHERPDGRGYPYGLFGEAVPFEARVVAVADAFQAMVSDRPQRKALSQSEALIVLTQGRGTQWDANVVDAMVAVVVNERNKASDAALPFAGHAERPPTPAFAAKRRFA